MPLIVSETVGHHSAGVALIVSNLINPVSANLLQAALLHDLAEQFTGDVPATVKWQSIPLKHALDSLESLWHENYDLQLPELTEREQKVLKEADMLDLCFKMMEEMRMGNTNAKEVLYRGIDYLYTSIPTSITLKLLEQIEVAYK
jgi:5'-deoxynucleotidase YfbR-like HD superfamily hydrolase